jgi:membrane protein
VPNRPVPARDGLQGGLLAALAIAALRIMFNIYVTDLQANQSLYGALAALPILLFWMYLVWAAVLAGAELTASLLEQKK